MDQKKSTGVKIGGRLVRSRVLYLKCAMLNMPPFIFHIHFDKIRLCFQSRLKLLRRRRERHLLDVPTIDGEHIR